MIVFILVILFLYYNLTGEPFAQLVLNNLETLSLITSMVTIYCGIFYISDVSEYDGVTVTMPVVGSNCKYLSLIIFSKTI